MTLLARIGSLLFFSSKIAILAAVPTPSPSLSLPPRPTNALSGSAFVQLITDLPLPQREELIFDQIAQGNVPGFLRSFAAIPIESNGITGAIFASPDYLAVGSDDDYFLTPMRPSTAQRIADLTHCILPTRKIVDAIYAAAPMKLAPTNLVPDKTMTTVPVFARHHSLIQQQSAELPERWKLGTLKTGHKKDVVISNRLLATNNRVAIYGWHRLNGKPIQPLFIGHGSSWVDYSHGIRLIAGQVLLNGAVQDIRTVLRDPARCALLSDEGPMQFLRYPTWPDVGKDFNTNTIFRELTRTFQLQPGVRVHINAPFLNSAAASKPLRILYYALPNGNTIEQSRGRKIASTNDWRFDNQHIDAQTRFLRAKLTNELLVTVYLEAETRSWPAWRKKFDPADRLLPGILQAISSQFSDFPYRVTLTGHSGGGSLIFGMINALGEIPDQIERIAFLDANYAFDPASGHTQKLSAWLKRSPNHYLAVLAYDDANALLDGKSFVSLAGGTWGRTHLMLTNLMQDFAFSEHTAGTLISESALEGRIQLLMLENPERRIWHTRMVELNGFIHSVVSGTPLENKDYRYLAPRAYDSFISEPE